MNRKEFREVVDEVAAELAQVDLSKVQGPRRPQHPIVMRFREMREAQLEEINTFALEIFKDQAAVDRFMARPRPMLEDQRPADVARTRGGVERVRDSWAARPMGVVRFD